MRKNHLIAGLAGTLAFASALAQANEPTVVLVTDDLPEFHLIQAETGSPHYVVVPNMVYHGMVPQADPLSMAIGAAIGAATARHMAAVHAQESTDDTLDPMLEALGDKGLQAMLRTSIGKALAEHGMDQRALAYFAEARPDPKQFKRLKAAREVGRFVLVGNGTAAKEIIDMPLAFDPSLRQLRLSLEIEVREGKHDRNRRQSKRDVTVYTTPAVFAEGEEPMQAWAADEHARLRAEVDRVVADAFALALSDRELPKKVDRDAALGTVGELGFAEFEAVLLEHADGRALLWTRDDSLVSIPADEVLTGEALVVARAAEVARKAELEALAEAAEAVEAAEADAAEAMEAAEAGE